MVLGPISDSYIPTTVPGVLVTLCFRLLAAHPRSQHHSLVKSDVSELSMLICKNAIAIVDRDTKNTNITV